MSEKVDPASDREDESEDVETCVVTGYVGGGRIGVLSTKVYGSYCC